MDYMDKKSLLKELNTAYHELEMKGAELAHALYHRSNEKEIGFSFRFPFDVEGKQILEFVKRLRLA